jgi:hypothetical protein
VYAWNLARACDGHGRHEASTSLLASPVSFSYHHVMELRTRVKDLMRAFLDKHGREPIRLHLTPADEIEILTLSQDQLSKDSYAIVNTKGVRHLTKLFGLALMFDASHTFVD